MKYSGFRVIKEALTGHRGWRPAWQANQENEKKRKQRKKPQKNKK